MDHICTVGAPVVHNLATRRGSPWCDIVAAGYGRRCRQRDAIAEVESHTSYRARTDTREVVSMVSGGEISGWRRPAVREDDGPLVHPVAVEAQRDTIERVERNRLPRGGS